MFFTPYKELIMKRILISSLMILFTLTSVRSQIYSIKDLGIRNVEGAYYQDLLNELNRFEGRWLYTDGNTSLELVLEKVEEFENGSYREDIIFGGYRYVENGVEKINTILNMPTTNGFDHMIYGNGLDNKCFYMPADDCVDGEIRLILGLFEPTNPKHGAEVVLHYRFHLNSPPTLKAFIVFSYHGKDYPGVPTPSPILPWQGWYEFVKQ